MAMSPDIERLIQEQAKATGVSPERLRRYVQIESGGNPNNTTGSYKGLLQLSDREFAKYGGGNIYSSADNLRAGALKMQAESSEFQKKYGRPPTDAELYLIHQQGWGGYGAHTAAPYRPAWQNMLGTGEGRQKGAGWAKAAIWGNVPDADKRRFGSVDNLTSKDFVDLWTRKVGGGAPSAAGAPPSPAPDPVTGPAPLAAPELAAAMRAPDNTALGASQNALAAMAGAMRSNAPQFKPIQMTGNIGSNSVTPGSLTPPGQIRTR